MMRETLLSTLMAILFLGTKTLVAQDSDPLRQGEPAACFLFDWGKRPDGFVAFHREAAVFRGEFDQLESIGK